MLTFQTTFPAAPLTVPTISQFSVVYVGGKKVMRMKEEEEDANSTCFKLNDLHVKKKLCH